MKKDKNYIPIVALIISITVLLFGNNIIFRISESISNVRNSDKDLTSKEVTFTQVDIGTLNAYRLFVIKEIVEEVHKKNPKYELIQYSKDDPSWEENGKDRYKFIEIYLNPFYESEPISEYKYYYTTKGTFIPLYAKVKDHIMLDMMPFSTKDSLIENIPELKKMDNVTDTIILSGIYTGASFIKYGKDVGGLYQELIYNKQGELKEATFEYCPD